MAHDLYGKLNGDFTKVAVVFPNKRASLFFNEYLAQESERPLWSPAYVSISDLFRHASNLQTGDPIKLVCDLYKVFVKCTGSKESLDDFYFWGEMLISDFDDADKNLVDTDTLFSNLKDLNALTDNYTFLEDGQKEALSQFFHNFSPERTTELKQRFASLWNVLGEIYTQYKTLLDSQGIAYEGMLYRQVIDTIDIENMPYKKYVFVGFNVLNKVEHKLFSLLNQAGKAFFYWDYDQFYLEKSPHEAGEFIRRNLRDFPSELPPVRFCNLNQPKEITYIESPTESGQARYLPQWIRENLTEQEKETAVVLCNETLLQPVLHSLPENIHHINITMGFPLSQTPAYSFVNALMTLHTDGYNPNNGRFLFAETVSVLKHPYTRLLSASAEILEKSLTRDNRFYPLPSELQADKELELLFKPCTTNIDLCAMLSETLKQVAFIYRNQTATNDNAFDQLYREALFKTYTLVNRFRTLTEEEVRAAYDRAETAYGWFYLETLPSGPQTQEVDGWTYERVDYPGMENLADLQAYLRGLFSEEMVDDLLAVGGSHPLYRDVDGVLYVLPSVRERDPSKGAAVIQVEHTGETAYSVDVTVDLLDENGETVTGVECYAFPYEFVEDHWVFTDFRMVY